MVNTPFFRAVVYNETGIETWRNDMTKGSMSTDKIGTVVVKGWVGGEGEK